MSETKMEGHYMLVFMIMWNERDAQLKENLKRKDYLDWTIKCAWDTDDNFTFIELISKQQFQELSAAKDPVVTVFRSIETDLGEKAFVGLFTFEPVSGLHIVDKIKGDKQILF